MEACRAIETLGFDNYNNKAHDDQIRWSSSITDVSIVQAGGTNKWECLSQSEQAALFENAFIEGIHALSNNQYSSLPDKQHRALDFFVWVGCSMHKELNTVKGGNMEMAAEWEKLGLMRPIPLYNKDNVATVQLEGNAALMHTGQRAEAVTEHGGVKTCSLSRSLFNHKDDKKGHHDSYLYWFKVWYKWDLRFPDTSNMHYGSYTATAAELFV